MKRNVPLLPGKPLQRKTPLKSAAFNRLAAREHKTVGKLKSRGMKGRTPTVEEQRFINDVAAIGCIACLKDGHVNPWISIHHIKGRTAPGAHMLVLGLCSEHHQHDDSDPLGRIGVHPYKTRFEQRYGTQMELLAECVAMIGWDAQKEVA